MRTAIGLAAVAAMGIALTGCPRGNGGGGCLEECFAGTTRCNGDAVESCGDYDSDSCMEFGGGVPCGTGTSCSFGGCSSTCTDECVAGSTECAGDAVRSCGESDSDTCTDLGAPVACPPSETCSSGVCGATCTDECTAGSTECAGAGADRACGDWDSDECLDWGPSMPCGAGEACAAASGGGSCAAGACTAATPMMMTGYCTLQWTCNDIGYYVSCGQEIPGTPWYCQGSGCSDCAPACTWMTSDQDPCASWPTGGCGFPAPAP